MLTPPARRRLLTRLLALLLTLCVGTAFAADPSGCASLSVESDIPHSAEWICNVSEVAEDIRLTQWIDGVAWLALLSFFVARTLMISLDPNAGPKLRGLMTASLFAFGLMASLVPVREAMMTVWMEAYEFSQSHGADAVFHSLADLADDLEAEGVAEALTGMAVAEEIDATPVLEGAAAVGTGVVGTGAGRAAAATTTNAVARSARLTTAASRLSDLARGLPVFRIIDMILMPVMTLYSMIVFGSGLTIIIGTFLLPIGAVMIVSGKGDSFFSTWTNVMLASIITMLVFPLMWGITAEVALATPIRNLIESWIAVEARYDEAMLEIASDQGGNPFVIISQAVESVGPTAAVVMQKAGSVLAMVFQIVIGLVTAFGLIFLLQQIVTRFLGGVVANAQSFGQTFGMLGRKGGGGQKSASTSTSSPPPNATSSATTPPEEGGGSAVRVSSTAGGTGATAGGPLRNHSDPIPTQPSAPAPTHASARTRHAT